MLVFRIAEISRAGARGICWYLAGLVPPSCHPEKPISHLGGALGGHRSGRNHTLWSGVGFYWSWMDFWMPLWSLSQHFGTTLVSFVFAWCQVLFSRPSGLNLVAWSSKNKHSASYGVQNSTCHSSVASVVFHFFFMFFDGRDELS